MPEVGAAELKAWLAAGPKALEAPRRGRILKLRLGVNPNSSSVGTNVVVFMWSLASAAAVLSVAGALLATRFAASAEGEADATPDPGVTPEGGSADGTGEAP